MTLEQQQLLGAFLCRGQDIGYAFVDNDCIMYIMQDVENYTESVLRKCTIFLLTVVFSSYLPAKLLVNGSSTNEYLSLFLDKLTCQKEFRLSRDFSTGKAMDMLTGQKLLQNCTSTINCTLGLGCAGAIMNELIKDLESKSLTTEKIVFFSLFSNMQIDTDSLQALGIFDVEEHPNSISGRSKEGFSVFQMMNFTKSQGGKKTLSLWLRRPLIEKALIENRLENVQFFITPQNSLLVEEFWKVLRKTKNISLIFSNLISSPKVSDFENLYKFCKSINQLITILNEVDVESVIITELKDIYSLHHNGNDKPALVKIEEILFNQIDFDKSYEQNRISFKGGLNEQLDGLKDIYHILPTILGEIKEEVAKQLGIVEAEKVNVIYFPQVGYLICLAAEEQYSLHEDYEIVISSLDSIYLKNSKMSQLDKEFGDIHSEIVDFEIELLQCLRDEIVKYRETAVTIAIKLFEIDAIISLSHAASKYKLTRPVISDLVTPHRSTELHESNVPILEAVNSNHILLRINNASVINNDIHLDTNSIRILTGPNCSGKSIYLKQIGILCVLAQAGSFVPAEYAKISIVDKLFTKISTKESIFTGCSSFQTELEQIRSALSSITENSLLLVDEFGKGTESADGIGLFCAILRHLEKSPPRALFTTHYFETYDILNDGKQENEKKFQWLEMDVEVQEKVNNVLFLYTVKEGICTKSLGTVCAKLAGLPKNVIERANEVSKKYANFEAIEAIGIEECSKRANDFCNLLVEFVNLNEPQSNDDEINNADVLFDKLVNFTL